MLQTSDPTLEGGHRLFAECRLFESLDDDTRRQLAASTRYIRRRTGELIFTMGSEGQSMMAVLAGTVRISVPSPEGKQIVLADLSAGEIFGEIAVLDGHSRSADATALTTCDLAVLSRRDVLQILKRHPDVCLTLLEVLCRRLRDADERMTDILFFDTPVRLAKVLLRRAGAHGKGENADPGARVALSQRELGNMVGVRRESINLCLRDWQRRGMIQLSNGWIVILQPSMLERLAVSATG
jgi:CRP/FNR family transcriptional regulator, cyclic AMP receptor protein